MSERCPKCGSKNTYPDDGGYGCMMCGKRFAPEGVKQIIVKQLSPEDEEMGKAIIDKYKLNEMVAAGLSNREIAGRFGCGKSAVCLAIKKLGLTPNYERKPKGINPDMKVGRKPIIDGEKVKALIEAGKSRPEIIAETGYKKESLYTFMKRNGLETKVDGRSLRYKNKGGLSPELKILVEKQKHKYRPMILSGRHIMVEHSHATDMESIVVVIDAHIEHHQKFIDHHQKIIERLNKAKLDLVA